MFWPAILEQHNMVKLEDLQQYGKEQFDAAVESAGTLSKGLQGIAAAVSDYSRKSFENGSAFVERLSSVKSLDKAIEAQTDYAKSSYETLVAESTKIGEIYADLAKEAYKPFETYISKGPNVA
jgi:phasin family protein